MIAAAGARFPVQSSPAAAPHKRDRHWTREVFFARTPDLRDEVREQIGTARGTWEELFAALWKQERRGRSDEVRSAARRGVLLEVGIHGIARFTGRHHTTICRHLRHLEELGLVRVHRQPSRLTRDENGKIVGSSGREFCAVIEVTVTPEHLRPFGARREGGRGRLSARGATPSRVFSHTPTGCGEKTNSQRTPQTPPREPALGAGSVPAEPAPVTLEIVPGTTEQSRDRLELRCRCGRIAKAPTDDVWQRAGLPVGRCPQCGNVVRFPREPVVHAAIQRLNRLLRNVARCDEITAKMQPSQGSMEGGRQVVAAGPAVAVVEPARGPEPEPEPATAGNGSGVASDARCPSTATGAGVAGDRAAAGTPRGGSEGLTEKFIDDMRKKAGMPPVVRSPLFVVTRS